MDIKITVYYLEEPNLGELAGPIPSTSSNNKSTQSGSVCSVPKVSVSEYLS